MAEAFVAAVAAIGSSVGGATGAALIMSAVEIGTTLFYVTAVAASMEYGASRRRAAARAARDAYNSQLQDRLVMLSMVDGPRSRCYGIVRNVDGVLFKGTYGPRSEYYVLVVAIAGHEIDGFIKHFADDRELTLDVDGWCQSAPYSTTKTENREQAGTGTISEVKVINLPSTPISGSVRVIASDGALNDTGFPNEVSVSHTMSGAAQVTFTMPLSGSYSIIWQVTSPGPSKLRVRAYPGTPGENLYPYLVTNFPSLLQSTDRFDTGAKLLIEMEYDPDAYPTGVPQFSSVIRGARLYDRRTTGTAFSRNPALIADDWAQYAHGGALVSADIIGQDIIDSANACDVSTDFVGTSGTRTRPLYQADLVVKLDGGVSPDRVMDAIVDAMAGRWSYSGGQLTLRAGVYRAPAITVDESWLADQGGIQIVPEPSIDDAVNTYRPTIADADQNWVAVPAPPYSVPAWVTADGRELSEDLVLSAVTDTDHATHVVSVMAREKRNGLTIQMSLNLRGLRLRLFTVFSLQIARYGWASGKTFEVLDWQFAPTGGFTVVAKEVGASLYNLLTSYPELDSTPNTELSDPFSFPAMPAPTCTSSGATMFRQEDGTIVPRILVTWSQVQDAKVLAGGRIELRYGRVIEPLSQWRTIQLPGDATAHTITDVQDGALYAVQLRCGSRLVMSGIFGPFAIVQAVGKSAAPAAPTGFTPTPFAGAILFTWNPSPEVDYLETELRAGASWASGTRIFRGSATSYLLAQAAPSAVTVWAAHYDTSGNVSSAVSVTSASYSTADERNYDFSQGLAGWTGISSVTTGDTGSSGGTYGQHGAGLGAIAYPARVPVDPYRRYRVTARIWSDAGGGGPVYIGVVPFDSAGNVLSNSGGATYPYCASIGIANAPGWRIYSGEISGVQAIPTTTLDAHKFPIGTCFASPMCFPYTGYVGPLLIDYLRLEDITDAVSAESQGFSVFRLWDFNSITPEGFTAVNATISNSGSVMTLTSTGADAQLRTPADLGFAGGIYDKVRMRVRRTGGTSWQGDLYYNAVGGHNESDLYKLSLTSNLQPSSDWTVLEWEVDKHATNAADWRASSISQLRFDLSQGGVGDQFEIDWIAIGRTSGPQDLSTVTNAQWVARGVSVNGDVAVKSRVTTAWDSDVYSREQFYGGAVASASFDVSTGRACMFGLNADPTTDSNYTSLDYAFYYDGTRIEIYESGAGRGVFVASPQPGDVYTVAYDGSQVYYMRNGTLLRSIAASPGLSFFFDSSFVNEGSTLRGMRFGPMTSNNWQSIGGAAKPSDYATADLTLVNTANCVQQGNRVTNTTGSGAWDAGMHSKDGYLGGAACSIYVHNSQTESSKEAMFGLNSTPASASYTDINFAFYLLGAGGGVGNLYAYLEGSVGNGGASIGTFQDNDLLAITYDGHKARWYKNGSLLFEVTQLDTTSRWHFDCSIRQVGEFFDRIIFRPMSMVSGIGTDQITGGAVSPIATAVQSGSAAVINSESTIVSTTITLANYPVYVSFAVDANSSYGGDYVTFRVKLDGVTQYSKDITATRDGSQPGNPWSIKGALVQTVIASPGTGTKTISVVAIGISGVYSVTVANGNLYVEEKRR